MKKSIIIIIIIGLILLTIVSQDLISVIFGNVNIAKEWNEKGVAFYRMGKYEEAIKAYDQSLKIEPNNYETWSAKGWALFGWGKYEDALIAFNQSLKIEPEYGYAQYGREHALNNMSK